MRVDQLVPAFHRGDAIGDTAFHMRNFFRSRGFSSEIYRLDCDGGLECESRPFASFPVPDPQDVTILHYALPSPLTQGLIRSPGKKAIIYHNITPHEFFLEYSPEMARISRLGREELLTLIPHVSLAMADSEYNRRELIELGFTRSAELPLFIDFDKYRLSHSRFMHDLFRDDRTNILFVGRIVPNKKIEDLIKVAFYYKKFISPLVRLVIVGKTGSLPKYYQSLVRMADEFYLNPEEIRFTGHIPDEEMYALYKASDVFLSLSEHEGFGLPFMESMVFDVPIVAYNCTAVPFTLDGAGILIDSKDIARTAELVNIVKTDPELRRKVIQGQRRRVEAFKTAGMEGRLLGLLEEILA